MIPYARQEVTEKDIDAVCEVLRSQFLTQGPTVSQFESVVSAYCNINYAIAVCNATAALHIACLALGLGPGDWLWTSPNTFVASANCARYCGAQVDFVDINPKTYNISLDALREKLNFAERNGCLPKIIVPVHFAGQACEMREIKALSEKYDFRIIEDASHALGGKYYGEPVGNCRYSDITIFSFHPVKIITTGEGGMALTNDAALAHKMCQLRSHGITRDVLEMIDETHGDWYYQQLFLGYNYRMTDIQAALGISQMARLDQFIQKRHLIAEKYTLSFSMLPIVTPYQNALVYSAYHLYPIRIDKLKRKAIFNYLRRTGIGVNIHYIPVHLQPYYQTLGFCKGMFPEAERYYQEVISLPIFTTLTDAQQDYIVSRIRKCLKK